MLSIDSGTVYGAFCLYKNVAETPIVPKHQYATDSAQETKSIPNLVRDNLSERILSYAKKHFRGKFTHIALHFRGALCCIDAYSDPAIRSEDLPPTGTREYREVLKMYDNNVTHLCRLRYFGSSDRWGFDFYSYSSGKYESSVFPSGLPTGTPEDAFDLAAGMYL